ncbi:MAG: hypothetical protein R2867_43540 [Caldilineaceae bacterium]
MTTNYVTGLEVVLADGEIIQFGGPALDYPEYDFVARSSAARAHWAYLQSLRPFYSDPPGRTMMVAFPRWRLRATRSPRDRRWTDAGNAGDDGPKDYGHHRRILNAGLPVNAGQV